LPVAVGVVIVEVEAAFADADDARMAGALDEGFGFDVGMGVGLVRVNPDGGPDIPLPPGEADPIVPLGSANRDVQHSMHTRSTRPHKYATLLFDPGTDRK